MDPPRDFRFGIEAVKPLTGCIFLATVEKSESLYPCPRRSIKLRYSGRTSSTGHSGSRHRQGDRRYSSADSVAGMPLRESTQPHRSKRRNARRAGRGRYRHPRPRRLHHSRHTKQRLTFLSDSGMASLNDAVLATDAFVESPSDAPLPIYIPGTAATLDSNLELKSNIGEAPVLLPAAGRPIRLWRHCPGKPVCNRIRQPAA